MGWPRLTEEQSRGGPRADWISPAARSSASLSSPACSPWQGELVGARKTDGGELKRWRGQLRRVAALHVAGAAESGHGTALQGAQASAGCATVLVNKKTRREIGWRRERMTRRRWPATPAMAEEGKRPLVTLTCDDGVRATDDRARRSSRRHWL